MSLFEFVITLYSIVIALGIARVLTGFAALIEFRGAIAHAPLLLLWLVYLLLVHIVWWISLWGFNTTDSLSLAAIVALFHVPAFLFIAARLLVPNEEEMNQFFDRFTKLRVPFLVCAAMPTIPMPLTFALSVGDWSVAAYLLPLGILLLLSTLTANIRAQYATAIAALGIYLTFAIQVRANVAG